METASPQLILDRLNWRYACKKFDPQRKIRPELIETLEQALISAPSGFGLQPWRFVVVGDPAVKQQLREHGFNQPQYTDCDRVVVIAHRTAMTADDVERWVARVAEVRGQTLESLSGFRNSMMGSMVNKPKPGFDAGEWAARQAYIALGFLVTSAALLGIDACPMEGFDNDGFSRVLKLDDAGYRAVATCSLGYRSPDDPYATMKKVRFDQADVVRHV